MLHINKQEPWQRPLVKALQVGSLGFTPVPIPRHSPLAFKLQAPHRMPSHCRLRAAASHLCAVHAALPSNCGRTVLAVQDGLRTSALGPWFFGQIATPKGVKNVLQQCYGDPAAVTDELVRRRGLGGSGMLPRSVLVQPATSPVLMG